MRAQTALEIEQVVKDCCLGEARKSLKRHRDVASCDVCDALLLAYTNERDFEATMVELRNHDVGFETASSGKLRIIAKAR